MKRYIRAIKRFVIDWYHSRDSKIKIFNSQIYDFKNYQFSTKRHIENHWLHQFLLKRNYLNKKISIWGVNGYRGLHKIDFCNYKIFFSVENVNVEMSPWYKYRDYFLSDSYISLSLGSDYINHTKYLRFPFWIQSQFNPTSELNDIFSYCFEIEKGKSKISRENFCAFICRDDYFGERAQFADLVAQINPINYPGNFRHNDDTLQKNFNDDKIEYLKQ